MRKERKGIVKNLVVLVYYTPETSITYRE